MCMACEEEALWRRYQLAMAVERDEIPPGFTAEDFEWAGLPVPSKRAVAAEAESLPLIPAQAGIQSDKDNGSDGKPGSPLARGPAEDRSAAESRQPENPFACDTPDGK
jgi:hypothetical protein